MSLYLRSFSSAILAAISFYQILTSVNAIAPVDPVHFQGSGTPNTAQYQLIDDYPFNTFFDKFDFYHSYDPTFGYVQYVGRSTAFSNGLVSTNASAGTVTIKPDTENIFPKGGPGRPSVRISSGNTYTHGLFILDVVHMPSGCGTWPAYWLLGPNWPYAGEIDIIEGVHTSNSNSISMHTSAGCYATGYDQLGTIQQTDCDAEINGNTGCGSFLSPQIIPDNYGASFNSFGGGVYASEWTSDSIRHWFFPRNNIPSNIERGVPDPAMWGEPAVNVSNSGCDLDAHFSNMSVIINIELCGAWAGNVYTQYPECPSSPDATSSIDACDMFVGENPAKLAEAYWEIHSLKVYQGPTEAITHL